MTPTKQSILDEAAALQAKRGEVLHALAEMEMDAGLLTMLRYAVYGFYAPVIELLEFEYRFIDEQDAQDAQDAHDAAAGNVV